MDSKEQKARQLLEKTREMGLGIADGAAFMGGTLPPELVEQLEEKLVEVYMKHYTEEEMDLSIELYDDPRYVSLQKKLPAFAKETMEITMTTTMEFIAGGGSISKPFLH